MKNLLKWGLLASLSIFTFTGCSSEDTTEDILGTEDPTDPTDPADPVVEVATIMLTEGGAADDVFYAEAEGEAGGTVDGRVIFTATNDKQKRLYVTQTLPGGSPEPFPIAGLTSKELKADQSIDLDGELEDGFDFTFTLDVPNSVNDGSIVYNFWSTSGRGDFRDPNKRLLIGVGSIEVKVGTGTVDTPVRTFGGVTLQLDAPLQDGSSNTFMSVYNGEIYQLNEGEELAAFWDFGYYYIASVGGSSLASTSNYYELFTADGGGFVGIADKFGIAQSELNNFYIGESSMNFDTVTLSSELDVISTPISQVVNGIDKGDVYEFEDQYGTKGLIKIIDVNGTNGSDAYVTFDIKVQAYSAIDTSDL